MAWEPDYVTVAKLASYLRIGDLDDNVELSAAVTAASRAIDHATNRQFGSTDSVEQRTFEVRWSRKRGRYITIAMDDINTETGLVVAVNGSAVTDYVLLPVDADKRNRPWTALTVSSPTVSTDGQPPSVTVDATFGWTAVPATIEQATLVQASRFYNRRSSWAGVAGSPELGNELRLLNKVDTDVDVMVRPYRRNWPML